MTNYYKVGTNEFYKSSEGNLLSVHITNDIMLLDAL